MQRDPLEAVAEEYFAACRGASPPSIEEFAGRHPELAEEILDLFPMLGALEAAGREIPDGSAELPIGERLGEYQLVRMLGRGGMGVVYEAQQESLERRVALKILPAAALADPRQAQRFRREVHAAARLRHPNIVPVHDVGEVDGVLYYSMQLIEGRNLDRVLEELRRSDGSDTPLGAPATGDGRDESSRSATGGVRYFESVARLGVAIARALEYAHSEGVLHRDLKPSNLLLDDSGTPWIVDFGLAKAEGAEEITHTGDVLGTPRYLAPESLRGWSDPRTDVYGLGITLYELLALRPAFEGRSRAELLRKIAEEEPSRPSRFARHLPRDLETIVLTAIAKEPARRYHSAAELADDLERFLRDEPIHARRPTLVYRAALFVRRHPIAVPVAAVGLLVIAGLLAGWIASLRRARDQEREAGQTIATEKLAADDHFQLAWDAVERMQVRLGSERLAGAPQLESLRREVLEDAVSFYREFLARRLDSPELKERAVNAWAQLAKIQFVLGRSEEAAGSFREAEALLRDMVATADGPEVRLNLATVLLHRGRILHREARIREADQVFEEGIRLASNLDTSALADPLLSSQPLLEACEFVGAHLLRTRRLERAEELLTRGIELASDLLGRFPSQVAARQRLAACLQFRAELAWTRGRLEEAEADLERAHGLLMKLSGGPGAAADDRYALADCWFRGVDERALGQHDSAMDAYDTAFGLLEQLRADFPEVTEYRGRQAEVRVFQGLLLHERGRLEEALRVLEAAIDDCDELVATTPTSFGRRLSLAVAWIILGNARWYRGRLVATEAAYRSAIGALEGLRGDLPDFDEVEGAVSNLALAYGNLGSLLFNPRMSGPDPFEVRPDQAEALLRRSLDSYRELHESNPASFATAEKQLLFLATLAGNLGKTGGEEEAESLFAEGVELAGEYRKRFAVNDALLERIAQVFSGYGLFLRRQGRPEEAEEQLLEALEIAERLAERSHRPDRLSALAGYLSNLGLIYLELWDLDEACEVYRRAISLQEEALARSPQNQLFRTHMAYHRAGLARALAGLGAIEEALVEARLASTFAPSDPENRFDVARALAQCARFLLGDVEAAASEESDDLAAEAFECLRRALELGFRDRSRLLDAEEFDLLRDRPEFAELLGLLDEQ